MNSERHIASFVVYVLPEQMPSLIALLAQWPGTDIRHQDASGKFVLINECASYDGLNQLMNHLHDQRGVLNVALVSHFVADEAELNEPAELELPAISASTSLPQRHAPIATETAR
ncbi:chaperone NapD [Permianibacter sp. IMCC34836]|uniref:chaperone NapD n=1 Tax=Permianibacter fluminis TaxID=2738515 RepID=UPI00155770DF|nr:chaperone NapD [Permianibacter fluminis]NQD37245.1 chaperone NapD [Permianibacter fluminis]